MALNTIAELVEDIRQGKMVILMDDEDRENEGDLIMAAECVRAEDINFMAKHARGLICMPMDRARCERLGLPLMVQRNGSGFGTKFTVSIEAAEGGPTGISAADRARTVQAAAAREAVAADIVSPGHIFPLMAQARRRAGARRPHRGGLRPGADGRLPAQRGDLRDHERRRQHGPSPRNWRSSPPSTASRSAPSPT